MSLCLAVASCRPTERQLHAEASPPTVTHTVDSILPIAEHLRRFREGVPSVDTLAHAAESTVELVNRVLAATTMRDTAALLRLGLSKAEYGWLYYPHHIYTDPPYELDPGTFWMMIQGNNSKGLERLLRYRGGFQLKRKALNCKPSTAVRPPLREWNQCELVLVVDGQEQKEQLFGSIVEIDGRYKLVSYANQF